MAENSDNFELEPNQSVGNAFGGRRRQVSAIIAVILAVALTLVLAVHGLLGSSPPSNPSSHIIPTSSAAAPAVPTSPPSASPFLTPSDSLLEPIPTHCPTTEASVQITEISYYADPAYGISPVWMLGLSDEQNQRVVHFDSYPPLPYTSHGFRWRILLVAAPWYSGAVTLSGTGADSALLLDTGAGAGPVAKLALNASRPIMRGVGWAEWPVYVYLPESGCYQFGAHWPGGSWTISFAAGI